MTNYVRDARRRNPLPDVIGHRPEVSSMWSANMGFTECKQKDAYQRSASHCCELEVFIITFTEREAVDDRRNQAEDEEPESS
ncbi:hypothetical protein V6N13_046809 [Hibiscus sabdariffa]|uniref:Uncharacterized protein n=2 Tax=Hibiscus sabdariffa TaxID=183260 RepID=A0ABR2A801_9ROSI